jgi:hypothetical protein
VASSGVLKAISLQSAAETATASLSSNAIGRTPGLSSLMKKSLKVCRKFVGVRKLGENSVMIIIPTQ